MAGPSVRVSTNGSAVPVLWTSSACSAQTGVRKWGSVVALAAMILALGLPSAVAGAHLQTTESDALPDFRVWSVSSGDRFVRSLDIPLSDVEVDEPLLLAVAMTGDRTAHPPRGFREVATEVGLGGSAAVRGYVWAGKASGESELSVRFSSWSQATMSLVTGAVLDDGATSTASNVWSDRGHEVPVRSADGAALAFALTGFGSDSAQSHSAPQGWDPVADSRLSARYNIGIAYGSGNGVFLRDPSGHGTWTSITIPVKARSHQPPLGSQPEPAPEPAAPPSTDPDADAQTRATDTEEPRKQGQSDGSTWSKKVSRNGMTITLSQSHLMGTYANGDPWILGPVAVTKIDPESRDLGGRVVNGAMVNPSPQNRNRIGYGHIRANSYDPGLNAAAGVSESSPLRLDVHTSLVTTISVEEAWARPGVHSAAVFTIVDEPPPPGSFRPPYSGQDKTALFNTSDLQLELLPRLKPVPGSPQPSQMAPRLERVWLDHVPGWQGRKIHPVTSMPDYGRDLAAELGRASLVLMLNYPDEDLMPLLVNFVQIGIDFYGIVEDGGSWAPDGGHAQGRKWPIMFAGTMLNDRAMASIGERRGVLFGEDAQTFYVGLEDVQRGNGYTIADIGMPEWGIRHATDPSRDSADWFAPYRRDSTANSFGGHVLSARIMGLKDDWNHDALFDYMDRYTEIEKRNTWQRFWDRPFTEAMWEAYRSRF